jgi:dTDP-glucose 4,6-dehydratase/UDP-glucuronate decarboxylase
VTGANGFLPSYLVDTVASWNERRPGERCTVIAVDNLRTGMAERLAHLRDRHDVRFLRHDVTEPLDVGGPVDWIVHAASIASPSVYRRLPLATIDANVGGTRHMLELGRTKAARGVLVLSSSEIYGDPDPAHIPTPESYRGSVSCTGPRACYDESKRLAETLALTYHRLYGLPVKIVRPFNVFGPGQRLDDGRIMPDLLAAALARRPIELLSDGRPTRSFCYVSDAVAAMWLVLLGDDAGEAFNVGNDREEITIADLARLVRDVAGPPPLAIDFRTSADRDYLTDNPQRRCPDLTKLRARHAWEPRVGLREGVARCLAAYREAPA